MKKIIIIVLLSFLLCGCYDYKEINELAICSGLGIEKRDDIFHVYLQVINTNSFDAKSSKNESPFILYDGTGKTIYEAIKNISTKVPKKIFTHHLKIIIIDKSLFNEMENIINFLMNDLEINLNLSIATTMDYSPKEILETIMSSEKVNSIEIEKLIKKNQKKLGNAYNNTIKEFYTEYFTNHKNNILSNFAIEYYGKSKNEMENIEKSSNNAEVYIDNLVVFNDKNIILLNKDESITLNMIKNKIKNVPMTFKCKKGEFSIETMNSNIKLKDFKDNTLFLDGVIKLSVMDYSCNYNLNNKNLVKKLKKIINIEIDKDIHKLLDISKKEKIDILGINKIVKRKDKKYYDKYKDDWNNLGLDDIKIKTNIKIDLIKQGNIKGDMQK